MTYGGVLNIVTNGNFTGGQTFRLFSGAGATNGGQFCKHRGQSGRWQFIPFHQRRVERRLYRPDAHERDAQSGDRLKLCGDDWTGRQRIHWCSGGIVDQHDGGVGSGLPVCD